LLKAKAGSPAHAFFAELKIASIIEEVQMKKLDITVSKFRRFIKIAKQVLGLVFLALEIVRRFLELMT
jgi:hypothetical protein